MEILREGRVSDDDDDVGGRRKYSRFEGSFIERAHPSCVLRRKESRRDVREQDSPLERLVREGGEEEREIEAEGVGVEALRDTTPVASTRLPKEPPFGNRPPESTCRPLAPRVGGRN